MYVETSGTVHNKVGSVSERYHQGYTFDCIHIRYLFSEVHVSQLSF